MSNALPVAFASSTHLTLSTGIVGLDHAVSLQRIEPGLNSRGLLWSSNAFPGRTGLWALELVRDSER